VQQDYGRAISGAGFSVPNIQKASIDLLQVGKRRVRPRLDWGEICQNVLAG
jgi:hypothetical protein